MQVWLCYSLTMTLGDSLPLQASVSPPLEPGGGLGCDTSPAGLT